MDSWPLNNMGWNCVGPLNTQVFFSSRYCGAARSVEYEGAGGGLRVWRAGCTRVSAPTPRTVQGSTVLCFICSFSSCDLCSLLLFRKFRNFILLATFMLWIFFNTLRSVSLLRHLVFCLPWKKSITYLCATQRGCSTYPFIQGVCVSERFSYSSSAYSGVMSW